MLPYFFFFSNWLPDRRTPQGGGILVCDLEQAANPARAYIAIATPEKNLIALKTLLSRRIRFSFDWTTLSVVPLVVHGSLIAGTFASRTQLGFGAVGGIIHESLKPVGKHQNAD